MSYCPNCSAELQDLQDLQGLFCWNCHADLGPNSSWKPVAQPLGKFREFAKLRAEEVGTPHPEKNADDHPFLQVLVRLLVGGIVWLISAVVLLFLLLAPAVPYGGRVNPIFLVILALLTLAIVIWILAPLTRLLGRGRFSWGSEKTTRSDGQH